MKKSVLFSALTVALFASCTPDVSKMESEFQTPPQEARPRVWWHWEDGNVTVDGIRKDLDWMNRIGIGGFHHFDASVQMDPVVEKRLIYMDDGWKEAFKFAVRTADSLGMSVGIASSPGWSSTGGPWVAREDAMKQFVWTSVDVTGGHRCDTLPQPKTRLDFYRDIRTIAFKLPESDGAARAITVFGNNRRGKWAIQPANYELILEASDDGKEFSEVCRIPNTSAPAITVNIPATMAAEFRLRYENGKDTPDFRIFTRSRVEHAEEKAGFSSPYDLHDHMTATPEGEVFADGSSVIDISEHMSPEGVLDWDAPEGEWRVLRLGYTLTGKKNGPAPAEATGLEVDKLDPQAWDRYFHKYLDMYVDASAGLLGQRGITELLVDSYEAGWQTWTPAMEKEFSSRRGYGLLPWMPALTGEVMVSPEATEKFLFDWRRTIGELYSENYGRIKNFAKEYHLRDIYLESQENGRVYVADGMDVKKHATVPMAACWVPVPKRTTHSTIPMAISDIRESASIAHIYGRKFVAAESFTADGTEGNAYTFSPAILKSTADVEFASGVNRIYVHESSSQPLDDCRPGLGLLRYGQWFTRHETWAEQAVAWTDYLARSSYMLQQGENIADILVYYGEDTNITARYGWDNFAAPKGYNFDFINPSGLFDLKVRGGRIIAPSGASYEMLCLDIDGLPQSEEIAARIDELKAKGARICTASELGAAMEQFPRDVETDADIRFVHRRAAGTDIYWINKPAADTCAVALSFRCAGKAPMCWDPVTGAISPVTYRVADGRTVVSVGMVPDDAKFIVFAGKKAAKEFIAEPVSPAATASLALEDWTLKFPERTVEGWTLADYRTSEFEDVKYFSGTASYCSSITLDSVPTAAWLDLGTVYDLAELFVNGESAGILWKKPFKAEISGLLKAGENAVEVRVTNVWVNRLIGDRQPDCPKVTTYSSRAFYNADGRTVPAGLIGPVVLISE